MKSDPDKYGVKLSCQGTWDWPEPGSEYLHGFRDRDDFIKRTGRVPRTVDYRAKCPVCKKDCALKANGTIHPHVNTPLSRKTKRVADKAAITHARADLLALHTELRTEAP